MLKQVTKEEFFEFMCPKNVHPRCLQNEAYWELPDRTVIGKSTPGYLSGGPPTYFIAVPDLT